MRLWDGVRRRRGGGGGGGGILLELWRFLGDSVLGVCSMRWKGKGGRERGREEERNF